MIGLDTNVLVRVLVEDDRAQSERAQRLVRRVVQAGETMFVSNVVLCEVVWVLSGAYKVRRSETVAILHRLLHTKHFAFEDRDALGRALDRFAEGRGDFADYVIREVAAHAGCREVATFDRVLLDEDGFVAP